MNALHAPPLKLHLEKIDVLRGVAILLVFLYHAQNCIFPGYELNTYSSDFRLDIPTSRDFLLNFSPFAFGNTGVHLFLLISGFLIHLGFLKSGETLDIRTFYSKRFWRIYPPFLGCLLVFSLFNPGWPALATKAGLIDFFSHFFLLHNLSGRTFYSINPSFWSLALEMQLYIIYPAFLLIRKKAGIKATFLYLVGLSVLLLLLGNIGGLNDKLWYANSVLSTWFIWGAGAFLAEKYINGKLSTYRRPIYAVLLFAALLLSKYLLFTRPLGTYFATFAWLFLFEWYISRDHQQETRPVIRLLSLTGICSYSIYLIHQPLLEPLLSLSRSLPFSRIFQHPEGYLILSLIPIFLLIFAISHLMYRFIELPSVKLGTKVRARWPNGLRYFPVSRFREG